MRIMANLNTAIFLGAGASKAEGAPLQGELFKEYFSSNLFLDSYDEMDSQLETFFLMMFGLNVRDSFLRDQDYPTFEEVLGLTDLAILRKESFKHFDIENRATNSGRLRFISQYLVFLVARVLDAKLHEQNNLHRSLIRELYQHDTLRNTVFVSTNYDILVDNALTELYDEGIDLDYGIDFRNFEQSGNWRRPRRSKAVGLFKPHGSLNWLFCPTCNQIEITPEEKGVVTRLISDFKNSPCPSCNSIFIPLIVPPTFYKDLNNVYLSSIWNKTDIALRKVDHIIFCGYSFPDADIHIKYLLKRAQTNRSSPLKFSVVNHFPQKQPSQCEEEEQRFKRFLGANVDYTNMSFEDFAANPFSVITTRAGPAKSNLNY